jgi:UDP-N-acetylmuramyl pentapeptide phosphotransferase/UDP-N-acetylglucosamine-1-phosphate transferase
MTARFAHRAVVATFALEAAVAAVLAAFYLHDGHTGLAAGFAAICAFTAGCFVVWTRLGREVR